MLQLIGQPDDIAALASVYQREILFRTLQGPLGWMLRDIAPPVRILSPAKAMQPPLRSGWAMKAQTNSVGSIHANADFRRPRILHD